MSNISIYIAYYIRTIFATFFAVLLFAQPVMADVHSDNATTVFGEQNGTNAGRYRSVKFSNGTTTNNGDGSISINNSTGGGGSGNIGVGTVNNFAGYVGINTLGPFQTVEVGGYVGVGTNTPQSKLSVFGGGIAGEMVNKGWELIIPSPFTGVGSEINPPSYFEGNSYIPYGTGTPGSIYKWDGNVNRLFYQLASTNDRFGAPSGLESYFTKLFVGWGGNSTDKTGSVYVYDPLATPVNFVQISSTIISGTAAAVTVPNDSTNNAIFGSTSYSAEYYGRIDTLGNSNTGVLIYKSLSAQTSGYFLRMAASGAVTVAIRDGALRTTTSNTGYITLGNYHHVFFSWTSGSAPKIYVDGSEVTYASSVSAGVPADDTANLLIFGNNSSANRPLSGTYRIMRIWRNYALTAADVTSLNSGGSAASAPTGEYLFSEGSGTTTADSSGNGNTGTIVSPAYWNTNLFELSYCPGTDLNMYALKAYGLFLFVGSNVSTGAKIYKFDNTTWSTSFAGLSGYTIVDDFGTHKGILFASLGGSSKSAIISSPDSGITWNTEATVASGIGFTRFWEFRGKFYAGHADTVGSNIELYVRNDITGTWSTVGNFPTASTLTQCWALGGTNNAMYVGCTKTGGAVVYKTYDGNNYMLDFTAPYAFNGTTPTEAFTLSNINGSMYLGLGFNTGSGDMWRKTDSLGQIVDWDNNFLNKMRQGVDGTNWYNDQSIVSFSSPWNFDSNVGIGSQSPGAQLDVNGTVRALGIALPGGAQGQVIMQNGVGIGTWSTISSSGGSSNIGIGTAGQDTVYVSTTSVGPGYLTEINNNVGINTTIPGGSLIVLPGNLGIGSNAPGQALDVVGNLRATGMNQVIFGSDNSQFIQSSASSGGNLDLYSNGLRRISINNGGNIGLGTTTPQGGFVVLNGNVGIGTWAPQFPLSVIGNVGVTRISIGTTATNSILNAGATNNFQVASTGNLTLSQSNPIITGSATSGSILQIIGGGGSAGGLNFTSMSNASGTTDLIKFTGGNSGTTIEFMRMQDNSGVWNIGIGSTIPGSKLDVQGTVRIINGVYAASQITAPTIGSNACGSLTQGTVSAGSTDLAGAVMAGTAAGNVTSCAVTFGQAHVSAPASCYCQDSTTPLALSATSTSTTLTCTTLTTVASGTITYQCQWNSP